MVERKKQANNNQNKKTTYFSIVLYTSSNIELNFVPYYFVIG